MYGLPGSRSITRTDRHGHKIAADSEGDVTLKLANLNQFTLCVSTTHINLKRIIELALHVVNVSKT